MIRSASAAAIAADLHRKTSTGDADAARALMSPDVVVVQPSSLPHGGDHHGLDGVAEMNRRIDEHWTRDIGTPAIYDTSALVELDQPEGDRALQITPQTWTSKRTGRSVTMDIVQLITTVDGLITRVRVFPHDTAGLLSTLEER